MDIVDQAELAEAGGPHEPAIPLTRTSWLTLFDETTLSGESTETLAQQGRLLPALATFHAVAFTLERLNRQLAVVDEANLERARTASRRTAEKAARQRLFNIYDLPIGRDADVEDTALADALRVIGRREGIDFRFPARSGPSESPVGLVDILDASGVRARRVRFEAEGDWWRGDSNAMLAFRAEDGRPVALLPGAVRALPGIRPGQQAQRPDHRSVALPRCSDGSLDVLSAIAVGEGQTGGPAEGSPCTDRPPTWCGSSIAGLPGGLVKLLPALALGIVAESRYVAGGSAGTLYAVAAAVAAIRPARRPASPASEHGNDAPRGPLGVAGRSRLLGPAHAPSAKHSSPPAGRRPGHVGNDVPESSRRLAGSGRRQPAFGHLFLLPVFRRHLLLRYRPRRSSPWSFSLVSLSDYRGSRAAPDFAVRTDDRRRASRHRPAVPDCRRHRQAARGKTPKDRRSPSGRRIIASRNVRRSNWGALEAHSRAFGAALPFLAGGALLFAVVAVGDRSLPVGDFLVVYTVFHRIPVRRRAARRVFRHRCGHAAGVRPDAPSARRHTRICGRKGSRSNIWAATFCSTAFPSATTPAAR